MATNTQEGRDAVALHAAYQVESLALVLLREAKQGGEGFEQAVTSIAARLTDLAGVLISVTGDDDSRGILEMKRVVHGPEASHG